MLLPKPDRRRDDPRGPFSPGPTPFRDLAWEGRSIWELVTSGRSAPALGLILALALSPPLAFGRNVGHGGGRPNADSGRGGDQISPSQAAQIARRQTGGRVLSVEGGRNGYRVKVLTPSGEIRYVSVPAGR
jgi:hypothetical protein